jgi:hypothetical protein
MGCTAAPPAGASAAGAAAVAVTAAGAGGAAGAAAASALPALPLGGLGSGGLPAESGTLPVLARRDVAAAGVKASCLTGRGDALAAAAAAITAGALCCLS